MVTTIILTISVLLVLLTFQFMRGNMDKNDYKLIGGPDGDHYFNDLTDAEMTIAIVAMLFVFAFSVLAITILTVA